MKGWHKSNLDQNVELEKLDVNFMPPKPTEENFMPTGNYFSFEGELILSSGTRNDPQLLRLLWF